MRSITWYIVTFGIPLLGLVTCTFGGVQVYLRAKRQFIGCGVAALVHLVATAFPLGLAEFGVKLGSYLANRHGIYVFSGEDTWALFTFMVFYLGLAVISNLALWIALGMSRRRHTENTTA